jgi:anti-sigma factor RsiW
MTHYDDASLIALIDGELQGEARSALTTRLEADSALRARYELLAAGGLPLRAAFNAVLDEAPVARMQGRFDAFADAGPTPRLRAFPPLKDATREGAPRLAGIRLREVAAGIGVCLLAAAVGAWIALSLAPSGAKEDWRSAVEQYTNLFTRETFDPLNPDASLQANELTFVGERVGTHLTPDNVALKGLRFTVAFMLAYHGSPLGAIAYVDTAGEPVLLCIIANQSPNAPTRSERRGDLSLASWSHGGRGYLVIGRIPEERATMLAQSLEGQI